MKCSNLAKWDCEGGRGPSSPSSADRPGIWERQKLGVFVQSETRCRDFLGTRRVCNCRPETPLLVVVALERTGLAITNYTAAADAGSRLLVAKSLGMIDRSRRGRQAPLFSHKGVHNCGNHTEEENVNCGWMS